MEWLEQPSELITKSVRFEQLVNNTCVYYYKKAMSNVSEDTVSFIRRSIHDMLKNKAEKDQIHSKLLSSPQHLLHDQHVSTYEYVDNNLFIPPTINEHDRVLPNLSVNSFYSFLLFRKSHIYVHLLIEICLSLLNLRLFQDQVRIYRYSFIFCDIKFNRIELFVPLI